jgi:hypothetical protein
MTDEQRRAIALARARQAQAAASAQPAASPQPERSFFDSVYENVVGRGAVDTPGERFGASVRDNLFGVDNGVTTPGERVNQLARGAIAGAARGVADVPALPANIAQLGALGYERLTGAEPGSSGTSRFLAGLPDTRDALAAVPIIGPESQYRAPGTAGEFLSTGFEAVGAGGLLGGTRALIPSLTSGLGSEAAGQLTEGTPIEPYARLGGSIAGAGLGAGAQSIIDRVRQGGLRAEFMRNTDSVDELRDAATRLYDDARATGTQATPAQTTTMASRARATLQAEGAITPSGRIAEMPSVRHAIATLDDYAGAPMNPTQMLSVRRALQTAAGSADGAEARLGRVLRNQFDEAINPLAPQIQQANQIYARMAQGELVEQTIELAGSQAGQFTGSGFENALRSQFRGLERKIIRGQIQASPDEVAMISHIARGGALENVLRDIGKAAPTGAVSLGMGAGVPFVMGNAFGGPVMGAAAAVTVPTVGAGSRAIATRLQSSNANFLGALARSGGQAPAGLLGNNQFSLAREMLAPTAAGLLNQEPQR